MIEPAARVFISYSRSDLEYARALRDGLIAAELAVWHDLKDIGTGQWWSQIAASIAGRAAVEHLVLLVSPAALASKIVEREWRLARREGKTASLVVPPEHKGKIEFDGLPGWMRAQHFFDLTHVEQFDRLTAVLRGPGQQAKRPMMAPPLPEAYVHRPIEFNRLKSALLEARGEPVAITAALRGAGGFGTSSLGGTGMGQNPLGNNQQGGQNFVGRDSADMTSVFNQLGRNSNQFFQQLNRTMGRGNRNRQSSQGENAALAVRVQLNVAFDRPQTQPAAVATAVRGRLERLLTRRNINAPEVEIVGDAVVLRGVAASESQRLVIEKLVSLEPGVTAVDNQMTVAEEPSLNPPLPPQADN